MKKLSLNLDFVREELSKEEMKKINGGFGDYCGRLCSDPFMDCGFDRHEINWGTTCPTCLDICTDW